MIALENTTGSEHSDQIVTKHMMVPAHNIPVEAFIEHM